MEFGSGENPGNKDSLVQHLQELLVKNHDARKGFNAAENASENPRLKKFLKKQADQKKEFVAELTDIVRSLNAFPKEKGSAAGTVHRTWMDIKSALTSKKDEAVLEECIRGEKESEKEYVDKLQKNFLPPVISDILKRHLAEIRITIAQVSSLEDLADNKAIGY